VVITSVVTMEEDAATVAGVATMAVVDCLGARHRQAILLDVVLAVRYIEFTRQFECHLPLPSGYWSSFSCINIRTCLYKYILYTSLFLFSIWLQQSG
jgi:hypothetical protein